MSLDIVIKDFEGTKKVLANKIYDSLEKQDYLTAFTLYKDYKNINDYLGFIRKLDERNKQ